MSTTATAVRPPRAALPSVGGGGLPVAVFNANATRTRATAR